MKNITKREYFTAAAMQGIAANRLWSHDSPRDKARLAIRLVDETLKQLRRGKAD